MSDSRDALYLMVEASLALAGFAGIVTALAVRGVTELPRLHRMNLVNLLATALGVLFMSLAALVALSAGIDESMVWRGTSVGGTALTLFFGILSVRTVFGVVQGRSDVRVPIAIWAVNIPLSFVCLLQIWNVVSLAAFWPVLFLLASLFAVGCYSFVRLLLGREISR